MINTGSIKRLWDHCIWLQAIIFSHTAHSNYELDNEVPETRMTVQTDDISNIYKCFWYQWVMFLDKPINYPYLPVILGHYFGPAIDFRSAMPYKILKANDYYVCRTTFRLLKPTELACSEQKQLRNNFDAYVGDSLGPTATIYDFDYKEYTDLTPDIDYYNRFDEDSTKESLNKYP